jgi:hypothetical protein
MIRKQGDTMKFSPCVGRCTDEGTHCEGCGRTHEEVAETKKLVMDMVSYAQKMNYENPADFAGFVANNMLFKLQTLNSN